MKCFFAVLIFLFGLSPLYAQQLMESNPNALKSIDGIVNEMLRIVSGEEGRKRNWQDFRNLFLSSARLTVLYQDTSFNLPIETVTLDEFIEYMGDDYYDEDFIEYELGKSVEEYNGIANVFQSYYVQDGEGNAEMGINSYQLVYFNDRWWIANLVWTGDGNGVPVPKKYLKQK